MYLPAKIGRGNEMRDSLCFNGFDHVWGVAQFGRNIRQFQRGEDFGFFSKRNIGDEVSRLQRIIERFRSGRRENSESPGGPAQRGIVGSYR